MGSRLVTWDAPDLARHADASITGLAFLEALRDGRVPRPPIFSALNFMLDEVSPGRAVYVFTPAEWHYNTIGTVHGGVASTLLDSAMGSAVHSVQVPGFGHATVELSISLVRALKSETGPMRCEGRVLHRGRRMATAEGKLFDAAGKLYAHGSSTVLIFPLEERTGG